MRYARWTGGDYDEAAAGRLRAAGYPALLSAVLAAREVSTPEESAVFLERERSLSHSPMLMKDMDKAVERISRALAAGEKMAVFGDYDVDGITATVLLVDYLRSRGRTARSTSPGALRTATAWGGTPCACCGRRASPW